MIIFALLWSKPNCNSGCPTGIQTPDIALTDRGVIIAIVTILEPGARWRHFQNRMASACAVSYHLRRHNSDRVWMMQSQPPQLLIASVWTCVCVSLCVCSHRLWLIPKPAASRLEMLCHRDFIPDRQTDCIQQLIAKANKKFCHTSDRSKYSLTWLPLTPGTQLPPFGDYDSKFENVNFPVLK